MDSETRAIIERERDRYRQEDAAQAAGRQDTGADEHKQSGKSKAETGQQREQQGTGKDQ